MALVRQNAHSKIKHALFSFELIRTLYKKVKGEGTFVPKKFFKNGRYNSGYSKLTTDYSIQYITVSAIQRARLGHQNRIRISKRGADRGKL